MRYVTLFLLSLFMYLPGEEIEFKPAPKMELKPAQEVPFFRPDMNISHELYIFGLSYHTNRDYDFNEENPGLGYSVELYEPTKDMLSFSWTGAFGTYKDSFSEQAYFAGIGPRATIGDRDGFHGTFSLLISYLDGSDHKGFTGIPFITLDYGNVGLGFTGALASKAQDTENSNMVAVFLKFTLPLDF